MTKSNSKTFLGRLCCLLAAASLVSVTGCSTPYRFVMVKDSAVAGNQVVFLLMAERGLEYGYLHHGYSGPTLARSFGIASLALNSGAKQTVRLSGTYAARNKDEIYAYIYGLCSTQSFLIQTGDKLIGKVRIAGQQIVVDLRISPHMVQDHLKAVFDKVGVHSRRELVSALMNPSH